MSEFEQGLANIMGSFIEINLDCVEKQNQEIEQLQQENKQLKEELQKADSITQSCIFEGKEESTINFRECLNKLKLYKEVIEEVREVINGYIPNEEAMCKVLNKIEFILDKAKDVK